MRKLRTLIIIGDVTFVMVDLEGKDGKCVPNMLAKGKQ